MYALRYNTASQEIPLGVFVDATDGFTAETALTIANTDIKLHKTGATTLANQGSGGATHISGGIYYAVLGTADTDVIGPMMVDVHVAGARPVKLLCCVYPAKVYDSLFAGTDNLEVDNIQIGGSTTAATRQSDLLQDGMATSTVAASPTPSISSFAGGLTGASYPDNCFRNGAIVFTSGSNAGLTPRVVSTFVSSTGVFTLRTDLPFAPAAGDTFQVVGVSS